VRKTCKQPTISCIFLIQYTISYLNMLYMCSLFSFSIVSISAY